MEQQRLATLNTARTNMEIAQNLSKGIPPSNPQIATILEGTERALQSSTLPPESQRVGHDAATLVHDMKEVFLEKNKDENLQGFIRDMKSLNVTAKSGLATGGIAPKGQGLIPGHEYSGTLKQGMESIKSLVKSLVKDSEFRNGLSGLFSTVQWGFYQRSHAVRSNVDQAWASDQFYTSRSNANLANLDQTSSSSGGSWVRTTPTATTTSGATVIPGTTGANILPTSTTSGTTVIPTSGATVIPTTVTGGTTVAPSTTRDVAAPVIPTSFIAGSSGTVPPKEPANEFQKKLANLRPMSLDERVEFRNRLFDSLLKLNRTPELRSSTSNFFAILSWIKYQATSTTITPSIVPTTTTAAAPVVYNSRGLPGTLPTSTGVVAPVGVGGQPDFKSIMKKFQRLVEEFSGSKSLDDLVFYGREFFQMSKNDQGLKNLFDDQNRFATEFAAGNYQTLDQIPPAQVARFDELLDRTDRSFLGLANHYMFWRFLEELQQVGTAIRDDPLRNRLALDTKVLLSDFIYYDSMGRPQLNNQVVSQLKYLVLPVLQEQLAYIPLPRIEGSDASMDYWVDGVILTTSDILPDNVKVDFKSRTLMNRPGLSANTYNFIRLTLDNVCINLKDVRFWYRKKTFPKMTDEGYVDFFLTRNGLRVCLDLLTDLSSTTNAITASNVTANADRLKVNIHDSKHDFLYAIVIALFKGRMKREIQLKIEEAIYNSFSTLNTRLGRLVQTMGERRSQAVAGLGAKTSQPIASVLNSIVNPSVTH